MTSVFRVYLDGTLLQDEPAGLLDSVLNIERDEELNGVFFQFTSELDFYGDGYNYLKSVADLDNDCSNVECRIDYCCDQSGIYSTLFDGLIPIGDDSVEWDIYTCRVTTKIENADLNNLLRKYGDYRVKIVPTGSSSTCIDNITSLTPIGQNFSDFWSNLQTGIYNQIGRLNYLFVDIFQQVLSFLSNNTITLDLDPIYTTLYQPQKLQITLPFANPLDTIRVEFTNYYGQTYQVDHVMGAIIGVNDTIAIAGRILHYAQSTFDPNNDRTNYFEKGGWSDVQTIVSGFTFNVINYLPWTNISISNITTPGFGSVVTTQNYQYGLKNLALTTSALLNGQGTDMYVTLNQLMRHAAQFHNAGFKLVKSGTTTEFQLKTVENLMQDTSPSITLDKVPNIKYTRASKYAVTGLTSPNGITDNFHKTLSLSTGYCFGDQLKIQGDHFSSQEFANVFSLTSIQEDELYFIFLKDGDYSKADQAPVIIVDAAPTYSDWFFYNMPYLNALIATRYFINSGQRDLKTTIPKSTGDSSSSCAGCPVGVIKNTNTLNLQKLYNFDMLISFSQARDLINNNLNYINFNDGKQTRRGFIKSVSMLFNSFIASFELYGP